MPVLDAALVAEGARLVLLPDATPEHHLAAEVADADLLLMCYAPITRRVIESARRLKAIVKYGVGIEAIDIAAARERSIPVVNVPDYAEQTVAEGAFALLLGLAKRFKPIHAAMQTQGWIWPEPRWIASDLAGKTLGLVGVGRIGRAMARMAGGFAMRVLGYDPHLAHWPHALAERRDDLDTMLAECDAVSLHCVLNASTRHLIGAKQLACLKSTALLVNVSRGELVDELAVLDALRAGRLAGAALDVYGREPLAREGHPLSALYALDNVLLWPHLTFYTCEAMQRLEAETLARCREALHGQPLTVRSHDSRLRAQTAGVRFFDDGGC